MIINLSDQNSVLQCFMSEIRDEQVQKDPLRFRSNLVRIGEIMAYEISKSLNYEDIEIKTPFGIAASKRLTGQPVLATILRSGLPLHQGFLHIFDRAGNAFISVFRDAGTDGTFETKTEYVSCPDLSGKVLIITDPLLASGASVINAWQALKKFGTPAHTHFASVIACKEGIEHVRKHITKSQMTLWTGAIDDELTVQSYIVPGLGDAGDLAYGAKTTLNG